ncbi:hypothetical protein [Actinoalloteichus hymeniacidonis]|uniref:hypothetical protein n=1 Tax=Actinoalloteichus hymeniacidonis TaxID=340345 RepID=UPI0012F7ADB5|nr:hypothetical protein [Actinoalloteichus hymeniacidonis]MBB5907763.1 hypothetical protein [Actinoalloteichus hymeniacidonis]
MRRPRRRTLLVVIAAVVLAAVTAVLLMGQGTEEGVQLREDRELSQRIAQLHRDGGSARLRDLTDGQWDRVRVFHHPVSRDFVERAVGAPIDMDELFGIRGHILVFTLDGEVQRAVYTRPDNLVDGDYSSELRIQTRESPSPRLELVDEQG